ALSLTPAQRKAQRAKAHALNPVVMIGNDGLTAAVRKEIDLALSSHGLIKIRILGDDRDARIAMYESICDDLSAAPIQHIGKLLVVWRPMEAKPKKAIPSKKVARAYQTARSNQRATGSRVGFKKATVANTSKPKRRKTRLASPKKAALG
ncbi:MAG: YhbY family RNA-binding protein, partial [Betaproteobacteria bacterium]|nr:YhbY family RNA-binding protein [Betaproteobacteria bacterium]